MKEASGQDRSTYLDNEFRQVFRNLDCVERIRKINVDEWIKYCKASGAGVVIMDAKVHYALYKTKLMPRDPVLGKRDLMAEIAAAAKKHEIKWGAYFQPCHTNSLVHDHPDWQQIMANGSPEASKIGQPTVLCYNSPYRQLYLGMLHEVAENYRPHCFFIDGIIFYYTSCFCVHCLARYQREAGKPMPRKPDWKSRDWYDYLDWRYGQVAEISRDIHKAIHSVDPKIGIIWNCMPLAWYAAQSPIQAQYLDFPCAEQNPGAFMGLRHNFSFVDELAFAHTVNRALTSGRQTNWYLWLTPQIELAEIESSVDVSLAYGAQVCTQEHCRHLPKICRRIRQVEPYLKDAVSAADVAFHYSTLAHNAYYQPGAGEDKSFFNEIRGLFRGLLHNQILADGLQDDSIETQDLSGFRAVILPNSVCLRPGAVANLSGYLENGGTVIATLETGRRDKYGNSVGNELLWQGSGLRFVDDIETPRPWYVRETTTGIELEDEMPSVPDQYIAFPGNPREWIGEDIRLGRRPDGVEFREMLQMEGIASCHLPTKAVEIRGDKSWKNILMMRFRRNKTKGWEECPAVLCKQVGKGRIWYCNFQLGTLMTEHEHRWWRFFIKKLVDTAAGGSAVQIKAPACVKAFLWRQPQKSRYVLHLVNELSSVGIRRIQMEDHVPVPCQVNVTLPGIKRVRQVVGRSLCRIHRIGCSWKIAFAALKERAIIEFRCDGK